MIHILDSFINSPFIQACLQGSDGLIAFYIETLSEILVTACKEYPERVLLVVSVWLMGVMKNKASFLFAFACCLMAVGMRFLEEEFPTLSFF